MYPVQQWLGQRDHASPLNLDRKTTNTHDPEQTNTDTPNSDTIPCLLKIRGVKASQRRSLASPTSLLRSQKVHRSPHT